MVELNKLPLELNQLPIECIEKILIELPIKDIFNCRLINRKFRNIIYNLELDELSIFLNIVPFNTHWFYTNKSLNINYSIKRSNLNFLQLPIVRIVFKKLRKLFIYSQYDKQKYDMKLFNFYPKLEHIELENLDLINDNYVINFTNLKTFSLKRQGSIGKLIKIICPQLSAFRTNDSSQIFNPLGFNNNQALRNGYHFYYLEKIKYLELNGFNRTIINFINLEILKVDQIISIEHDFLLRMPKLKEILFFGSDHIFKELNRQKSYYSNKLPKIYFMGINLDTLPSNLSSIKNRYHLSCDNLEIYIKNCTKLSNQIPFIRQISYDSLKKFAGLFEMNKFLSFFNSIKIVDVKSRIENEELFILFLRSIKSSLNSLFLQNTNLNVQFYIKLSKLCPSLNQLEIIEDNYRIDNFEFISNLNYLTKLSINQELNIKVIKDILTICEHLNKFNFKYNNNEIIILRRNSNVLECQAFSINLIHNSVNNLVKFLEAHQNIRI